MKKLYILNIFLVFILQSCRADFFRVTVSVDMSKHNDKLNKLFSDIKGTYELASNQNLIIIQMAMPIEPEWETNLEFNRDKINKRVYGLAKKKIQDVLTKSGPIILNLNKIDYWPEKGIVAVLFDNNYQFSKLAQNIYLAVRSVINEGTRPIANIVSEKGKILPSILPYITLARISDNVKILKQPSKFNIDISNINQLRVEVEFIKKVPGVHKHVSVDYFSVAVMVNLSELDIFDDLLNKANIQGLIKPIDKSMRHLSIVMFAIPLKSEWTDIIEKRKEISKRIKGFVVKKVKEYKPNLRFNQLDYWPSANKIVSIFNTTKDFNDLVNQIVSFVKKNISREASVINKTMDPVEGLQTAIAPHVSLADALSNKITILNPFLSPFSIKITTNYQIRVSVIDLRKEEEDYKNSILILNQLLSNLYFRLKLSK